MRSKNVYAQKWDKDSIKTKQQLSQHKKKKNKHAMCKMHSFFFKLAID